MVICTSYYSIRTALLDSVEFEFLIPSFKSQRYEDILDPYFMNAGEEMQLDIYMVHKEEPGALPPCISHDVRLHTCGMQA